MYSGFFFFICVLLSQDTHLWQGVSVMYLVICIKISWELKLPNKAMKEHNNLHVCPLGCCCSNEWSMSLQCRAECFFFFFLTHLGLSYIPIPQKAPTAPRSFSCYVLLGLLLLDRRRGEQRKWQIRFKEVQKPHKMFTNCMLVFTVVVVHVHEKAAWSYFCSREWGR